MKTDTNGSTTDYEMMTGCLRLSRKIFLKIVESFTGSGVTPDLVKTCRRNLVLTDLLAFAIDFWMLPRYIPEHFGIFPKFNDGRR